jgi:hypothetical protein
VVYKKFFTYLGLQTEKTCRFYAYSCTNFSPLNFPITTPKCVPVHFGFHHILSEFGHFYHGETSQASEWGPITMDSELI